MSNAFIQVVGIKFLGPLSELFYCSRDESLECSKPPKSSLQNETGKFHFALLHSHL